MRIIIAGGGTGGHIYPALSLANKIKQKDPDCELLFVGTKNGQESTLVPENGFNIKFINSATIKGKNILKLVPAAIILIYGVLQSLYIIFRFKPTLVIGVGGYVSFPMIFAGFSNGNKIILLEQNSVPGIANRFLGKLATKVFLTFESSKKYFNNKKVVMSGNPLREELLKVVHERKSKGSFNILVVGGSQGSVAVNNAVIGVLKKLGQSDLARLKLVHQAGTYDYQRVLLEYENIGVEVNVKDYFEDIWNHIDKADLVISRSGSGIMELAAFGKPAILIPYPHAADNHQYYNAKYFEENLAAILIEESDCIVENLFNAIIGLMNNKDELKFMSKRAKAISKINASELIADECINLGEGRN
ncbi:MAG: undecaprenyldiphospho-muramoylpentapeptide beta-N-acetylglucosaminyltransferase [Pseudomonadota bacterium]